MQFSKNLESHPHTTKIKKLSVEKNPSFDDAIKNNKDKGLYLSLGF